MSVLGQTNIEVIKSVGFGEDPEPAVAELQVGHYANMHMQYTTLFRGCKNDNFQMKIVILFLF